jgi:hypothetical protein
MHYGAHLGVACIYILLIFIIKWQIIVVYIYGLPSNIIIYD